MTPTAILAALAMLVLFGMFLESVFRRTGIPDVLVLLIVGLLASVSGVFDVADLKGIDRVFTTAALVLILFEGAVRIRLSELRSALAPSLLITLVGFVLTSAIVGLLATLLFGMRPLAGLCLGVILGGTSSAVVIPMVGVLPVQDRTRTVLTLESALTDVLCIVFTLVLVGALSSGDVSVGAAGLGLAKSFGGAVVIGVASGAGWAFGLREVRNRRASILVLGAAVFLVYAFAELLSTYGAIAVLAFGLVLGNARTIATLKFEDPQQTKGLDITEGEKMFLGEVAFLLKVLFFVYLGAALKLDGYEPFVFGGLVTVVIFALRPIVVRASLAPTKTPRKDAIIASAMVPKGLAAAVLAAVPSQAKVAEGARIEAIVFGVVLFSITVAAMLVLFRERPFVANGVGRFFGAYPDPPAARPGPKAGAAARATPATPPGGATEPALAEGGGADAAPAGGGASGTPSAPTAGPSSEWAAEAPAPSPSPSPSPAAAADAAPAEAGETAAGATPPPEDPPAPRSA
jgi:potassium/hydrogen antiporter